jgi:hypothetical protein
MNNQHESRTIEIVRKERPGVESQTIEVVYKDRSKAETDVQLNEIERGQLCQSTIESLYKATGGLTSFPGLLKTIIIDKAWERRVNKGRVIELSSLRELITEKPIRGWGEDPKMVEAVIKDDPECLAMFREAMKSERGGDHTTEQGKQQAKRNNVTDCSEPVTGNSKAYTCERLSKVAPELFEEVKAGRMSANAAAIQAGIRKKPTPEDACLSAFLKADNKLQVLDALIDKLTNEQRSYFIESVRRLDTRDTLPNQGDSNQRNKYVELSLQGKWIAVARSWLEDNCPCSVDKYYQCVSQLMPTHIARFRGNRNPQLSMAKAALYRLEKGYSSLQQAPCVDVIDGRITLRSRT